MYSTSHEIRGEERKGIGKVGVAMSNITIYFCVYGIPFSPQTVHESEEWYRRHMELNA